MNGRAHLLIADSIATSSLANELRTPSIDTRHILVEKLGIDAARKLKEESAHRPLANKSLVFVIVTKSIELEAQNALLKLFEEPPTQVEFFLIIPHESRLIPTLRSRFVGLTRSTENPNDLAKEFLNSSYKERLEFIATEHKKGTDSLRHLFISLSRLETENTEAKKSLLLASRYVYNRGAGQKMLLEELALSLPVTN